MVERIKIFGERNAGTNFAELIVKSNFFCAVPDGNLNPRRRAVYKAAYRILPYKLARSLVERDRDRQYASRFPLDLGWKHSKVPNFPKNVSQYPPNTGFIAIVKNPYSWLLSLHAKPYQKAIKAKASFSEFLREPWPTVGRECAGVMSYENPVRMWNDKVSSYFNLADHGAAIVFRYEDILESTEQFVARVSSEFNLECRAALRVPSQSTKGDGRGTAEISAYYARELWREKLSDPDITFINRHIDHGLLRRLGYPALE